MSDLGVDHPAVSKQLKVLQNKLIQAGIKQSPKTTAQRIGVGKSLLVPLVDGPAVHYNMSAALDPGTCQSASPLCMYLYSQCCKPIQMP